MSPYEKQILERAIDTYGPASQISMLTEEMGELLAAVNRYSRGRVTLDEIASEIADVQIMLDQLVLILQRETVTPVDVFVKMQRLAKIERLVARLDAP